MILSCERIKFLGYNSKTNEYSYQFKIIDSDFEEVGVGAGVAVWGLAGVGAGVAVIDVYEKRNLPVAPNLLKALLYSSKKYGFTIEDIICHNKQYNPKFSKYEKDIDKYLLLL